VSDDTPKIDLRVLGEPARLINGAGVLDIVGRRDRTLLVVFTKLLPFQDREALKDMLSTLRVPSIIVPEEFVQDLTLLSRDELKQIRDAVDALIEDQAPMPLTPEKAKDAAARVYEGLKQRPELREAVLALFRKDAEEDLP
jgi:hypothetical protein